MQATQLSSKYPLTIVYLVEQLVLPPQVLYVRDHATGDVFAC